MYENLISELEIDILKSEVKWGLQNIASSCRNRLNIGKQFNILQDDAVKVLLTTFNEVRITQQWPRDWKR